MFCSIPEVFCGPYSPQAKKSGPVDVLSTDPARFLRSGNAEAVGDQLGLLDDELVVQLVVFCCRLSFVADLLDQLLHLLGDLLQLRVRLDGLLLALVVRLLIVDLTDLLKKTSALSCVTTFAKTVPPTRIGRCFFK